MKKKAAPKVKASLTVTSSVGSCYLFTNIGPMVCPRCGVTVPVSTEHQCGKKD